MVVEFCEVGYAYPGRGPLLHRLNLGVASGEIVAIVGQSGEGKTTLLKLVNRLLVPTSGTVLVEGRATTEWDRIQLRRRIGYVFQEVGLFPHMSVEENVTVVPRLENWAVDRARARAHHLLELVGLPHGTYGPVLPHELSGGQRQRVGLARALAVDPPILLMDEPFGALDPITRLAVRREFAQIQQQMRTTVIVVTHDMSEAFGIGDRVGVLHAGELVACGTPGVVSSSADPRVRAFVESIPKAPLLTIDDAR
jgi:osmoprotectant transport system ATP-binding protein